MSDDAIHEADLRRAAGRWTGCDWPTRFGEAELDLNGMRSDKALADGPGHGRGRARPGGARRPPAGSPGSSRTPGRRARPPEPPWPWSARASLAAALEQARFACTLEAGYPHPPVWQPLRLAIEATLSDGPTPKSLHPLSLPADR